jgi:hypothetical protein
MENAMRESWLATTGEISCTAFVKTFGNGRAEKCVSLVDFPNRGAYMVMRSWMPACSEVLEIFQDLPLACSASQASWAAA